MLWTWSACPSLGWCWCPGLEPEEEVSRMLGERRVHLFLLAARLQPPNQTLSRVLGGKGRGRCHASADGSQQFEDVCSTPTCPVSAVWVCLSGSSSLPITQPPPCQSWVLPIDCRRLFLICFPVRNLLTLCSVTQIRRLRLVSLQIGSGLGMSLQSRMKLWPGMSRMSQYAQHGATTPPLGWRLRGKSLALRQLITVKTKQSSGNTSCLLGKGGSWHQQPGMNCSPWASDQPMPSLGSWSLRRKAVQWNRRTGRSCFFLGLRRETRRGWTTLRLSKLIHWFRCLGPTTIFGHGSKRKTPWTAGFVSFRLPYCQEYFRPTAT